MVREGGWQQVGKRGKARVDTPSPSKGGRGGGRGRGRGKHADPARERAPPAQEVCGGAATPEGETAAYPAGDGSPGGVAEKDDLRMKLWNHLYENVTGAVDELYFMCELECNEHHIQHTIDLLMACTADFRSLKERAKDQQLFLRERAFGTIPSIAWEVKRTKSSPKSVQIIESLSGRSSYADDADVPIAAEGGLSDVEGIGRLASNGVSGMGRGRGGAGAGVGGRHRRSASGSSLGGVLEEEREGASSDDDEGPSAVGMDDLDDELGGDGVMLDPAPATAKRSWVDVLEDAGSDGEGDGGTGAVEKARSLHAKLMSPDRNKKRSPLETKRMVDEKQARATRLRDQMEAARQARLARAAEEREAAAEREAERLARLEQEMEVRHERSRELREQHLATVIRRAGEESRKVNEVLFIHSLEAQNKTMWIREKMEMSEARRQERLKSIQLRQQTAAEEAQERRQRLEDARRERIALQELRHERARAKREEMEAEREQRAAAERRRRGEDVEKRAEAAQKYAEERRARLQVRLQEGAMRRRSYLAMIRERADMTKDPDHRGGDGGGGSCGPSPTGMGSPSPTRQSLDGPSGGASATALVGGGGHHGQGSHTTGGPGGAGGGGAGGRETASTANRLRGLRRRATKLRGRLAGFAWEWREADEHRRLASEPTPASRRSWLQQMAQDLDRHNARKDLTAVESALGQLLAHINTDDERHLARMAGLLKQLVAVVSGDRTIWPARVSARALRLLDRLVEVPESCEYMYRLNLLSPLVPSLVAALGATGPCDDAADAAALVGGAAAGGGGAGPGEDGEDGEGKGEGEVEEGSGALLQLELLLSVTVRVLRSAGWGGRHDGMGELLVGYIVAAGVVHRLRDLFSLFDRPQAEGAPIPAAVEHGLRLLELLAERCRHKPEAVPLHEGVSLPDSAAAGLVVAARETSLMGLPSLLTAVLLRASPSFAPANAAPDGLPPNFTGVAAGVMRALNNFSRLDLPAAQAVLGASDMRVELFHLISFLLSFCTSEWAGRAMSGVQKAPMVEELLHEVVVLVGHFALLSSNQDVLQWGKSPTIMVKLAALPAEYFEREDLQEVLMPTLLSACYKNEGNCAALQREGRAEAVLRYVRGRARAAEGQEGPDGAVGVGGAQGRWPSYLMSLECRFPRSMWREAESALSAAVAIGDGARAG